MPLKKLGSDSLVITSKIMKRMLKKVGENLHYMRRRRQLTQLQLGKLVGVSQYHISRFEYGDQVMKISLLFKFSRILNVTTEELLDVSDSNARFLMRDMDDGIEHNKFLRRGMEEGRVSRLG